MDGQPTREELNAELLDVPSAPPPAPAVEQPGIERVLASALSYVRARRGGDLAAVLLVGSGAKKSLTAHSDLDLIALVKGQDEGDEVIRIADRHVEIRYRGTAAVEQELLYSPRLPPLLRKARVLFELDATGSVLVEKAQQRFRQGPAPTRLNERIRLKTDCLHWLGKAEDLRNQPAAAQYLFLGFAEQLIQAFFRLRGFWLTAPADTLRFIATRDAAFGELLERMLSATTLEVRLDLGRQAANLLFKDVPNPQRVD
jgi:predicted nucleotidyltransferase